MMPIWYSQMIDDYTVLFSELFSCINNCRNISWRVSTEKLIPSKAMNYLCRGFTFRTLNNWYLQTAPLFSKPERWQALYWLRQRCDNSSIYRQTQNVSITSHMSAAEIALRNKEKLRISFKVGYCLFSRTIFNIWTSIYYTVKLIMTNIFFPDGAIADIVHCRQLS